MRTHTIANRLGPLLALTISSALLISPTAALGAPPENDNFAAATSVSPFPFSSSIDLTDSTVEARDPANCPFATGDVWYRIDSASAQAFRVTLSAPSPGPDVSFAIYRDTGSGINGLATIYGCIYSGTSITLTTTGAETYYVKVSRSLFATTLTAQLDVDVIAAPANDNFTDATAVTSLPFADTVDTLGATVEPNEPLLCSAPAAEKTVWYSYTATANGPVTATVPPTYGGAGLAVYTGSSLPGLTQLACQYGDVLTIYAEAETTYYFQTGLPGQGGAPIQFLLDVSPPPVAGFWYFPGDPTSFDTVQFISQSHDPGRLNFTETWDFGDGSVTTGFSPQHRFVADGDYTTTVTVTTADGRVASASQDIHVRSHDVEITRFDAPNSARLGQTRQIKVGVSNSRYPETVEVILYKSIPNGEFVQIGSLTQAVPAGGPNKSTDFNFNYAFTDEDPSATKVTFKAIAIVTTARDALPADNTSIAFPTRLTA